MSKIKQEPKQEQECYCIRRCGSGYAVFNQHGKKITEENMFQIAILHVTKLLKKQQEAQ